MTDIGFIKTVSRTWFNTVFKRTGLVGFLGLGYCESYIIHSTIQTYKPAAGGARAQTPHFISSVFTGYIVSLRG